MTHVYQLRLMGKSDWETFVPTEVSGPIRLRTSYAILLPSSVSSLTRFRAVLIYVIHVYQLRLMAGAGKDHTLLVVLGLVAGATLGAGLIYVSHVYHGSRTRG